MKKRWMPAVFLISYVAAFAANVGYFAWSYSIGRVQISTSAIYMVVWVCESVFESKHRMRIRLAVALGPLTALGGVLGLLTRMLGGSALLTIPALLTAGLSITPLYGVLSLAGDYDLFYTLAVILGAGVYVLTVLYRRQSD